MRRASSKVILSFKKSSFSLLFKDFTTHFFNNQPTPSQPHLKISRNTHDFFFSKFKAPISQFQIYNTIVEPKQKSKLEEAFACAETSGEMLKLIKQMEEANFDEEQLALPCLKLGIQFDEEGENLENSLNFVLRAFNVLDKDGKFSFPLVTTLQLLGSIYMKLKRFSDSLDCLNKAKDVLYKLDNEVVCQFKYTSILLYEVELALIKTYTIMGWTEEAHKYARNIDLFGWRIDRIPYPRDENYIETEIYFKKRTEPFLEKFPRIQFREKGTYAQIGRLYMRIGKAKQAIPYLEYAAEKVKEVSGSKCWDLGYDYEQLGEAYLQADRPEEVAKVLEFAKNIIPRSNLRCADLARAYYDMGSYTLAISLQEKVVDAYINAITAEVNDVEDEVHIKAHHKRACQLLEQYKRKADGRKLLSYPEEERWTNLAWYCPIGRHPRASFDSNNSSI